MGQKPIFFWKININYSCFKQLCLRTCGTLRLGDRFSLFSHLSFFPIPPANTGSISSSPSPRFFPVPFSLFLPSIASEILSLCFSRFWWFFFFSYRSCLLSMETTKSSVRFRLFVWLTTYSTQKHTIVDIFMDPSPVWWQIGDNSYFKFNCLYGFAWSIHHRSV